VRTHDGDPPSAALTAGSPSPRPTELPENGGLPEVIAYAALFRREYPRLVALAWGLTGSRETAEDVAQEALLVLHRRWDELDRIENPTAYVRRTCANLAVSWVRRRVREAKAIVRLEGQRPPTGSVEDSCDIFWAAVRKLPRRQAQVVALFYGYDLSVEEVSEVLQLSKGTVKAHLHRARTSLEPRLAEQRHLAGEVG
jgi:RNA polymerase sigma-70 factor (ECF subfamily)